MPNNFLLDTNHASRLVSLGHPLRARVVLQASKGDGFYLAAPVLTELIFGFLELPRSKYNLEIWAGVESTLTLLPILPEDARAAAELRHALRKKGHQLLPLDALIAATALRDRLILLTTDTDFSSIAGLDIESWL